MTPGIPEPRGLADPTLLVVEDDDEFARILVRSFSRRGYVVQRAASLDEVREVVARGVPQYCVVDLKLKAGQSGLACVQFLLQARADAVIVVLTGYASIATAVEAIKLGARHYLAKPVDTDEIEQAFGRALGDASIDLTSRTSSIKTLEWEHIHKVLADCGFNISEAARRLGMHRRTLARKLEKRQVK